MIFPFLHTLLLITHSHTHMHIHTYAHTHIRTYVHTHTNANTVCNVNYMLHSCCTIFFLLQAPDAGTKRKAHTHMHIHTYTHECRHCLQRKLHTTHMCVPFLPSAGPRCRHQAQSAQTHTHTDTHAYTCTHTHTNADTVCDANYMLHTCVHRLFLSAGPRRRHQAQSCGA